jgi:hypothetical protein
MKQFLKLLIAFLAGFAVRTLIDSIEIVNDEDCEHCKCHEHRDDDCLEPAQREEAIEDDTDFDSPQ